MNRLLLMSVTLLVLCFGTLLSSQNVVSAAEKDEALQSIRKNLLTVSRLTRRKKFPEAEELLKQTTSEIAEWQKAKNYDETHRDVKAIKKVVANREKKLKETREKSTAPTKRRGRNSKVSFARHVLPLLQEHCFSCHDANAAGRLQLDNEQAMRKGGRGGKILVPGNPRNSLLMKKLVAKGEGRMPKNTDPLSKDQLVLLNDWIAQGAKIDKFQISEQNMNAPEEKVVIARPTGNETVSFSKDIAPFFVSLCLGCHNDRRKLGDFSMATFQQIMEGGESGEVLIPGDLENSRLFRLTGGLELPRMPNNDSRLTRKNYEDLKTWVKEGVKFDGKDPKATLQSLLPTEEELAKSKFAKMSSEEIQKHRRDEAEQLWRRVASGNKPVSVQTDNFLLMGDVKETRLQQASKWAEDQLAFLQKKYKAEGKTAWAGRLAVLITADRFLHNEFSIYMQQGDTGTAPTGIVKVTAANGTAFIQMLDTGNAPSQFVPGLKHQLKQLVSEAYLIRGGVKMPQWFQSGRAQLLALESSGKGAEGNPWYQAQRARLKAELQQLVARRKKGETTLHEGFLSPTEIDMYSFAAIQHFQVERGGEKSLSTMETELRKGTDYDKAFRLSFRSSIQQAEVTLINFLRNTLK